MMRKEKYYNYVLEDLVKDTRIDYDEERIYFPFLSPHFPLLPYPSPFPSHSPLLFSSYVEGRYGIKKDDIKLLWDQYKQRIKEIIEKNIGILL